jgi:hypothetical protein
MSLDQQRFCKSKYGTEHHIMTGGTPLCQKSRVQYVDGEVEFDPERLCSNCEQLWRYIGP